MKDNIHTEAITIMSSDQSIDTDGIDTMMNYYRNLQKKIKREQEEKQRRYAENDIKNLSELYSQMTVKSVRA